MPARETEASHFQSKQSDVYLVLGSSLVVNPAAGYPRIAKKNGAMYGLMNFAFETYKDRYSKFDFGGSDVESVATFYKKFGAIDNSYYNYLINDLPLWFNLLKKIKG